MSVLSRQIEDGLASLTQHDREVLLRLEDPGAVAGFLSRFVSAWEIVEQRAVLMRVKGAARTAPAPSSDRCSCGFDWQAATCEEISQHIDLIADAIRQGRRHGKAA